MQKRLKKALAVIAYNRFEYFGPVLASILKQTVGGRPVSETYDIFVFQDGLWEGEKAPARSGHEQIQQLISQQGPGIKVFQQSKNLAVAGHFDFIEKKLFRELAYDVAVFCEEDMVLAPGYMSAMDMLAERYHDDPRVGMFSANPENTTRSLEEQRQNRHQLTSMGHNWGFGMSRQFWERRQPFVELYLKWFQEYEYRKRPSSSVFAWLEHAGFKGRASSQDYVKQCATSALGAVRLATSTNYGRPIGESGLHSRPETFRKLGFDRTVVFDELPTAVPNLDDARFAQLWRTQASHLIKDPASFDCASWSLRLRDGALSPDPFIASAVARRDAIFKVAEADIAACYKLFLGRLPENDRVVSSRVGMTPQKLLESFLLSDEFSRRTHLAPLMSKVAASLERRRKAEQAAATAAAAVTAAAGTSAAATAATPAAATADAQS